MICINVASLTNSAESKLLVWSLSIRGNGLGETYGLTLAKIKYTILHYLNVCMCRSMTIYTFGQ